MHYFKFSDQLKQRFGEKVYKITIDAGFSCPNRDGTVSSGGCIFCDDSGSFSQSHSNALSIEEQIAAGVQSLGAKFKAKKFMAYFQAYSNTYKPVNELKEIYDRALSHPDIVGISIGTRPDCIDEEKAELISRYAEKYYTWVELGLQSAKNETLDFINRGHDLECFEKTYNLLKSKGINVCAHIILGLPNETREDMINTAKYLAKLNIDGVKIHCLCVLKGTELARLYDEGKIKLLSEDDYVNLACDFLECLPKDTSIHRIAGNGLSSIHIEPQWLNHKFKTLNAIDKELERRTFSGL